MMKVRVVVERKKMVIFFQNNAVNEEWLSCSLGQYLFIFDSVDINYTLSSFFFMCNFMIIFCKLTELHEKVHKLLKIYPAYGVHKAWRWRG